AEMLQSGRLERARALLELGELRDTLKLEEADHHAVVRLLAQEHPEMLERNGLERQRDELRREAAHEAIAEVLRQAEVEVLDRKRLTPALEERLARLERESGLNPTQWRMLLEGFGPEGTLERQRLERLRGEWMQEEGLRSRLQELAAEDGVLRPLALAMGQRCDGLRRELARRLEAAGMEALPTTVPAAGSLSEALDLLWRDPDPDTAGWVLMVADERDGTQAARYRQDPRSGLPDSPFLQSLRQGPRPVVTGELAAIATASLFADMLPEGIVWVSHQGRLRVLQPGEVAMEQGSASVFIAMVLQGEVRLRNIVGGEVVLGPGETVGEIGVITDQPRNTTVWAGAEGATLFVLPSEAFEELLKRSRRFDRSLLSSLARRLMAMGLPRAYHRGAGAEAGPG
ncbi:MAG: cyclic nucleotide-binding domain-containing protein, partial [Synechococcaceae cyanobacterium]|nr:cyclic nucleotide-binding domain-containing protein [Synechococcaceae cyanobacterium]